jgi:nitrate reductase / nitrite oxidoreductase, beta subunit
VLVDQDKCRGWRMCISGCPYKKIYFNWKSGKAEKCIFCYPRIEAGQPTVCSESCVGRIRYLGVILYDADRIEEAASVIDEKELYEAQLKIFLDPNDPEVIAAARAEGIPEAWLDAAVKSPVYKMAIDWKIAFPLHPEYRTLPMVWYVPPLSPIQAAAESGQMGMNGIIPDTKSLRIPITYLANLLTGGKEKPIVTALDRLLAMRAYMRGKSVDGIPNTAALDQVGSPPRRPTRCTATWRLPTTRTASSSPAPTARRPSTPSRKSRAAASPSATAVRTASPRPRCSATAKIRCRSICRSCTPRRKPVKEPTP